MVDFGDIWEVFKVLAKEGGLGVIHAEDNDIVMHMYAKLIREGRVGFENLAEVHNTLSEDLSFRRVLRLAESVPGTALYMMHVSAATGVAAISRGARQGPADLRREPAPVHAAHGRGLQAAERADLSHLPLAQVGARTRRRCGTARSTAPSTASPPTSCAAPCARRRMGRRIDDTTGGNSGVEPRLGVMYTEMVVRRGYSLPRYVDLVSTNAAKIMGLYPRKGAIAAGSDADIAILDPAPARQGARGGPARDRLHALGGPRHLRLAGA